MPDLGANVNKWITPVSSTVTRALPNSLPPVTAPLAQPPLTGGTMDPISATILMFNTNPYLIGALMLLLNLGGRFLSLELTKKQEAFLQTPWIRPLIFFTVIFMATRNVVVAFWITTIFFFVVWVLANEKSSFCIIPGWCEKVPTPSHDTYKENVSNLV